MGSNLERWVFKTSAYLQPTLCVTEVRRIRRTGAAHVQEPRHATRCGWLVQCMRLVITVVDINWDRVRESLKWANPYNAAGAWHSGVASDLYHFVLSTFAEKL